MALAAGFFSLGIGREDGIFKLIPRVLSGTIAGSGTAYPC